MQGKNHSFFFLLPSIKGRKSMGGVAVLGSLCLNEVGDGGRKDDERI